jgi:hypothetical protein
MTDRFITLVEKAKDEVALALNVDGQGAEYTRGRQHAAAAIRALGEK